MEQDVTGRVRHSMHCTGIQPLGIRNGRQNWGWLSKSIILLCMIRSHSIDDSRKLQNLPSSKPWTMWLRRNQKASCQGESTASFLPSIFFLPSLPPFLYLTMSHIHQFPCLRVVEQAGGIIGHPCTYRYNLISNTTMFIGSIPLRMVFNQPRSCNRFSHLQDTQTL